MYYKKKKNYIFHWFVDTNKVQDVYAHLFDSKKKKNGQIKLPDSNLTEIQGNTFETENNEQVQVEQDPEFEKHIFKYVIYVLKEIIFPL